MAKRLFATAAALFLAFAVAAQVTTNSSVTGVFDPARPGPIGGTTPGPVTATTITADGGSVVRTLSTNYVSGTGTAGVDNTAQTVVTVAVAANKLTQVGDRIRVRSYWIGDTGSPITGTLKLNGVTIAATADGGAATFQVNEAWLHYVDATHANIISMAGGALDTTISAANVAGFNWAASQNITISQNQIANNHIVVFFVAGDIFPK